MKKLRSTTTTLTIVLPLLCLVLPASALASTQIFMGGTAGSWTAGSTFHTLNGTNGQLSNDKKRAGWLAVAGTFSNLHAQTSVVPGGSETWTVTLLDGTTLEGVTCTITSAATSCADTLHTFTAAAGDLITIKFNNSGAAPAAFKTFSIQFTPTTANQTAWLSSGISNNADTSLESYMTMSDNGNSTTESSNTNILPEGGTFQNLYVGNQTSASPGTYTFSLRNFSANATTSLTCVDSVTTCTDLSHTYATSSPAAGVVGDQIDLAFVPAGGPAATGFGAGLQFTPTVAGDFVFPNTWGSNDNATSQRFLPITGDGLQSIEASTTRYADTMTITDMQIALNTATGGSGKIRAFTIRQNNATTTATCSINNGSSCRWTGTLNVALGDTLDVVDMPSGSPSATTGKISIIAHVPSASVQSNLNTLSRGLIGYWPFDGGTTNWTANTTRDLTANANAGTLVSMTSASASAVGKINGGLKFNGTTSYVSEPTLLPTIQSVAFWAKATTGASQGLVNFTGSSAYLSTSASKVISATGLTSPTYYIDGVASSTPGLYDSNWHQVVVTTATAIIGSQLEVGRANGVYFGGTIDEVRLYSGVLSTQEVQQLYHLGTANTDHSNTVSLTSGLVGYWPLDGSTTNWAKGQTSDLSGQAQTGTLLLMSTTTSPAAGKIGGALKFNGTSQYITAGNGTYLSGGWTVGAWINPSSYANYNTVAMRGNGGQRNYDIYINQTTGTVDVDYTISTNSFKDVLSTGTVPLNKWSYVTGTFDGATLKVYINGVLDKQAAQAFTPQNATGIGIGSYGAAAPADYFRGSLDDVRIYNRALSTQEVAQLYNLGSVNADHSNTTALSPGLVGYWPFDGNTINWATNTFRDLSGRGNTATSTLLSTSTSPVAGKIGSALKFNGASGQVSVGQSSSLNNLGPMTVSAWIKPNSVGQGSLGKIVAKGNGTTANDWQFYLESGAVSADCTATPTNILTFTVANSAAGAFSVRCSADNAITLGKWQHVIVTWDGTGGSTGIHFYTNGAEAGYQASATGSGSRTSEVDSLFIGNRSNGSRTFDGTVDDVRIYNRVLSSQEAQQLYSLGKTTL